LAEKALRSDALHPGRRRVTISVSVLNPGKARPPRGETAQAWQPYISLDMTKESMQDNSMQHTTDTWQSLRPALLAVGQEPDRVLLDRVKSLGPDVVPALIDMATDRALHYAEQDDPAVWAPLHALQILGEMEAPAAVEPLLPLLAWDDPSLAESVEEALGKIGRPALDPLGALIFDRSQEAWTRNCAVQALEQIAQSHPDLMSEVAAALVARLDAVERHTPDDETLNGFIISSLLELKAEETLPAIRRAFDEDRVDTMIVDFDSVQREFDLPGAPPLPAYRDPLRKRDGLNLRLKCTACGFERPHLVKKVYCDLGTMDRRKAGEEIRYSEYVIPQRITCPKCGAVDRYELGGNAMLTLSAELLARLARHEAGEKDANDEGPLVFQRFTLTDGREMHPYEARDMYRRQIEAEPERADLRLRYGNVLSFLGYQEEAEAQYRAALDRDPTNIEVLYNLGNALYERGNREEARLHLEQVVALAPSSALPRARRNDFVESARETLRDLSGTFVRLPGPPLRTVPGVATIGAQGASAMAKQVPLRLEKVGRNEPCPCGSGLKYKKCHGR
jgi:tetratricopeptide (TPR) repeat protein